MKVTKETWDLAELKWLFLAQGGDIDNIEERHPELEKYMAYCSFCQIFRMRGPWTCRGCLLKDGRYDDSSFTHCCGGGYINWDRSNDEGNPDRKLAGATLRFIRARRKEWENSQ